MILLNFFFEIIKTGRMVKMNADSEFMVYFGTRPQFRG